MPYKPKQVKRSYQPETKPFGGRSVDNTKFYNSYKWRKFTKRFKQYNPFCELYCKEEGLLTPVQVVDHKEQFTPGAKGWDLDNLKEENYTPACHKCHNKRSGKQRHGRKY